MVSMPQHLLWIALLMLVRVAQLTAVLMVYVLPWRTTSEEQSRVPSGHADQRNPLLSSRQRQTTQPWSFRTWLVLSDGMLLVILLTVQILQPVIPIFPSLENTNLVGGALTTTKMSKRMWQRGYQSRRANSVRKGFKTQLRGMISALTRMTVMYKNSKTVLPSKTTLIVTKVHNHLNISDKTKDVCNFKPYNNRYIITINFQKYICHWNELLTWGLYYFCRFI